MAKFKIGDRVIHIGQTFETAKGCLRKGATGTIINTDYDSEQLCMSWDGWTEGHSNSQDAEIPYAPDSLWWMWQDRIELDMGGH